MRPLSGKQQRQARRRARCLLLRPILIFKGVNRNEVRKKGAPAGAIDYDLKAVTHLESHGLNQPILRADVAGMPLEWVDYKEAARLYTMGQVALLLRFAAVPAAWRHQCHVRAAHGARDQFHHRHHRAHGHPGNTRHDYIPPLNNQTLFRRDGYLCLYCAQRFPSSELSRDHIQPFSQGGLDRWSNVATACRRCNNAKASRTPEQAKMQLIAVPFTPTYAEYIFLKGRRVLTDQMQYLLAHFPRSSPLHERIRGWLN